MLDLNPPARDMTPEQVITRGVEADRLLTSEVAQEVRNEVRLRIIEAWAATAPEDVSEREKLHATFNALDFFDDVLRAIINDGHHAAAVRDQREQALDG